LPQLKAQLLTCKSTIQFTYCISLIECKKFVITNLKQIIIIIVLFAYTVKNKKKVERDTSDEKEPGREERSIFQRSENERGLKNTLRKLAFH